MLQPALPQRSPALGAARARAARLVAGLPQSLAALQRLGRRNRHWFLPFAAFLIAAAVPVSWSWTGWFGPDSALYYQPCAPFLAGYLAWARRDRIAQVYNELVYNYGETSRRRRGGLWLAALSCLLLLLAEATIAPVIAFLALVGIVVGVILHVYGAYIVRALAAPLLYLLVFVPIPGKITTHATTVLMRSSAETARVLLKLLHVKGRVEVQEGLWLVLPQYRFPVTSTFSGLSILLPVLALTLWLVLLRGGRLIPAALLGGAAALLAIGFNVLRIVLIGLISQGNPPLAATLHALPSWPLMVATFGLTLLLSEPLGVRRKRNA